MAYYQNDDGEWYSDEMLYSDTVNPDDVITYGPGSFYTEKDLVNPNNDFTYNPDAPQTYGDASSYDKYINSPSLIPTLQKTTTGTAPAAPSFLDSVGNFLKTPTGQAVGIGGLAALLGAMGNKGTGEIYKGYQGGIPNYSATRTMNAIPTTTVDASGKTVARRPGQGGITYFSPMRYTGAGAATSGTPPSPAAGIAALPEANTAPATAPGAYSAPTLEFSTPNIAYMPPIAKAAGGLSSLGGYSDGGRLLRGPGDGISDSIPATIGQKQPARLADGEFVVPARIVSEIGNGSTEAGARKLYAMMDRVQKARGKTLKNVAANSKADKYLPA